PLLAVFAGPRNARIGRPLSGAAFPVAQAAAGHTDHRGRGGLFPCSSVPHTKDHAAKRMTARPQAAADRSGRWRAQRRIVERARVSAKRAATRPPYGSGGGGPQLPGIAPEARVRAQHEVDPAEEGEV